MKLGTETGSLVNHIYSTAASPAPEVGMGCTMLYWTDRKAATVVEVNHKGRYIVVQQDRAVRVDDYGMSEHQEYEYKPDPNGATYIYRKMRDGRWVQHYRNRETGRLKKGSGTLALGRREKYHDFSF